MWEFLCLGVGRESGTWVQGHEHPTRACTPPPLHPNPPTPQAPEHHPSFEHLFAPAPGAPPGSPSAWATDLRASLAGLLSSLAARPPPLPRLFHMHETWTAAAAQAEGGWVGLDWVWASGPNSLVGGWG